MGGCELPGFLQLCFIDFGRISQVSFGALFTMETEPVLLYVLYFNSVATKVPRRVLVRLFPTRQSKKTIQKRPRLSLEARWMVGERKKTKKTEKGKRGRKRKDKDKNVSGNKPTKLRLVPQIPLEVARWKLRVPKWRCCRRCLSRVQPNKRMPAMRA